MSIVLIHDSAEAFIAAGAYTNAGGNTIIEANTSDNVFTAGITGSGAAAAGVNGVAKVTVIRTQTKAYIGNGAVINADSGYATSAQSVYVLANGHTYIVTAGASGGGAAAAAVGGAANIGVLTKDTQAFIGESAKVYARQNIVVSAESTQLLVAVTASIFGAGAAAVSGDVGTFTFANTTKAFIDRWALVDSEGNVKVSADDDSLLISVVGVGNGAGVAAVGAVVSVNTIVSKTMAYIADGATVNARGNADGIDVYTGELGDASALSKGAWDDEKWIDTDGDGIPDTQLVVDKDLDFKRDGISNGSLEDGIDIDLIAEDEDGNADITHNINIPGEGLATKQTQKIKGLSVIAVSNQKIITTTIAVAGAGIAGVTGGNTTNVLDAVTEAYIADGVNINQNNGSASSEQMVIVEAFSNALMVMTEGTIGGAGIAGVSGAVNVGVISNTTRAHAGGNINAKRDIRVIAWSEEDMHIITANGSGAIIAGVGAAAAVGVVDGQTLSYVHKGADLRAGRDIIILAYNDCMVNIDTISGAIGGAAGVGGGVTVGVITHTTRAYVENAASLVAGAKLYAARTIDIRAESIGDIIGIAVGGAGSGAVGVAGAVVVNVVNTTTQAYIGSYTRVNQVIYSGIENQTVRVVAIDKVTVLGIGGSPSYAGLGGVGAAVDVTVIRNTVTAYIGANARVNAKRYSGAAQPAGNVIIQAQSIKDVDSYSIGAAGGAVAGISAAVSVVSIGARLDADSRNSLKNAGSFVDGEISNDFVTGQLGGSEHTQDLESSMGDRLTALNISSYLNETSAASLNRTRAYIGAGAQIEADNDINVHANDATKVSILTGGASIGVVGVGGGVGVATINTVTEAFANSNAKLSANGNIIIEAVNQAEGDTQYSVTAFGGSAGLVGIGAAVAYLDVNNTVMAYINSGVQVLKAKKLIVRSIANNTLKAEAVGTTAGVGALGASLARANLNGFSYAYLNNNIVVDASSLTVTSSWNNDVIANAIAGAAGILSGSGNQAKASASPTVSSYLGSGAVVTVSGDVNVTAHAIADACAKGTGVSVGGVSIGVSLAQAVIDSDVSAYFGNNVSINAGRDIIIKALHNYSVNGSKRSEKAQALANASGGSALVGATGANVLASHTVQVNSYIGSGANITAGRDIIILSLGNINGQADGNGNSGGVVGIGGVVVNVSTSGIIKAYIDSTTQSPSSVTAGSQLTINALGSSTPTVTSQQAAGGVVSGGGSSASGLVTLQVDAYLGTSGGVFKTNTGSITVEARGEGSISAQANGINIGGISVGVSTASANWLATINASVGSGTKLIAGNNIDIIARHVNALVRSYATTSTGSLVGGTGSVANTTATSILNTTLGQNSRLEAGNNIKINSQSSSITEAEASGRAYGLAAAGITAVTNTLINTVNTQTQSGAFVDAGNISEITALSTSNARKSSTTGGAGGVAAGASTSAVTELIVMTTIVLGTGTNLTSANINRVLAESNMEAYGWAKIDTGGAVTLNRTQSNVNVIALTRVDIMNGCTVRGGDTEIAARVIKLHANSYAYSKTYAAHSNSEATSRLNVESYTYVIARGATLRGGNTLKIISSHAWIDTNSNSHGEIGAGAAGSIITEGSNNLDIQSFVDVQSGSKLYSDEILVEAISPRGTEIYGKNADAVAHTAVEYVTEFIEKVITKVETVVEKVIKWLPWPLNNIVKWVTKTITTIIRETVKVVKEVILDSEVTSRTPGSFISDNGVNLEGDIYLGNAAGVTVIIDPDGTIHTTGNISAYRAGNDIIINPFVNQQVGMLTISSPRGAATGNAVIHQNSIVSFLEIINNSNLHLRVNGINLINNDPAKPNEHIIAEGNRNTINVTYTTDIKDMPTVNITSLAAANIFIAGLIESMTGTVNISAAGGNIYFVQGGAIEAYILNMAAGGSIGQTSNRATIYVYKNQSLTPVININAGVNGYLNIILREIRAVSSSDAIDGLTMSNITAGNILDILTQAQSWTVDAEGEITLKNVKGIYYAQTISSGNTLLIELVSGDLQIDGSIIAPNNIQLIVSGSILRGKGSGPEIRSGNLNLTAGSDIGGSGSLIRINLQPQAVINANAGGSIYLQETLGSISLGLINASGYIHLISAGSIIDNDNTHSANIVGRNINLVSLTGSIGAVGSFLDINSAVSGAGKVDAQAAESIYIFEAAGNLSVGVIASNNGDVHLIAAGSILDYSNNDSANIIARHLTLETIGGSLGTLDNFLDISAKGVLNASALYSIYLYETLGNMNIGLVISSTSDIFLKASGSILDSDNNDSANIVGKNINLISLAGSIGKEDNFLDIDSAVSDAGKVDAQASESIYLSEAAGDLCIGVILSDSRDIHLTSAGSILDYSNNDSANIIARHLTLETINGSLGTLDNFLDISAKGVLNASALYSIYLYETAGNMNVGLAISSTSDIFLKASGSILDSDNNDSANIVGRNINLVSLTGSIGMEDNFLDINSAISAAGSVDAQASESIYIYEAAGDISVDVIVSDNGDVHLIATSLILDNDNTDKVNIIGRSITLTSLTGSIGMEDNFLDINSAVSAAGAVDAQAAESIYISEVEGDLNVGVIVSNNGDVHLISAGSILDSDNDVQANIVGRSIILTSHTGSIGMEYNFLDINSAVSATGSVNAQAAGSIYIYEVAGNLSVGDIVSDRGDLHLISAGSILDNDNTDQANMIGRSITLTSLTGSIGMEDNFLNIDSAVVSAGKVAAQAAESIYIFEAAGDLSVGVIISNNGDVHLLSTGSILDNDNTDSANVIGRSITLTSLTGSIGMEDNFLDINSAVNATGKVDAQAAESIYISEAAGNLSVGVIVSDNGDVHLISAGSILDNDNTDLANVIGRSIILASLTGSIGTEDNFLDINSAVSATGAVDAQAAESIYISEVEGNLSVGVIVSDNGDVHLISSGSILDNDNDDQANVIGRSVILDSHTGSIGTEDNLLDINSAVSAAGAVDAQAAENIYIYEAAGDLSVGVIASNNGDVHLISSGSILDNDNDDQANVIGRSVILDSHTGSIGTKDNFLNIDSAVSGAGKVDAQATESIYIYEAAGDLSVGVIASNNGDVHLISSGSILDNDNDDQANVIGRSVILDSHTGSIGTKDNFLNIDSAVSGAGKVDAQATESIYIYEAAGGLSIGVIVSDNGDVHLIAAGSILDNDNTDSANIVGRNINLVSHTGSIGTEDNFLNIDSAANEAGAVDAQAAESIYISEAAGNLSTGVILSYNGDVHLTATGSILDYSNNDSANIMARNVSVETISGSLGALDNYLDISAMGVLNASAFTSIYLYETANNMNIGLIISSAGDIFLKASGDILDHNRSDQLNAIGNNISLESLYGGIGTLDYFLNIAASGWLNSLASGNIYIFQTEETMSLISVTSRNGDVYLRGKGSIVDYRKTDQTNVSGRNIILEAIGGGIGNSSNCLDIDSSLGGSGLVNATSPMNIYLYEVRGDMTIGLIESGSNVYIRSAGGIISGQKGINISVGRFRFEISSNIGTASRSLMTRINYLEGKSGNGSIWLTNAKGLTLGLVEARRQINLKTSGRLINGMGSGLNIRADQFAFDAPLGVGSSQRPLNIIVNHLQGSSVNGAVWIVNTSNITMGPLETRKDINITATGNILSSDNTYIKADRLFIYSLSGIGTAQSPLAAMVNYLDGSGGQGSIWISNTSQLTLGFVQADRDIYLKTTGQLLGDAGIEVNILSDGFWFEATSGIGTQQNPINTMVNNLAGTSQGSVWLINTGQLTIGGINGIEGIQANRISITTKSPITVIEAVISEGDIVLSAEDSNLKGDNITVRSAAIIHSTTGSIILRAGNDIILDTGSNLRAAGEVTLLGDYGNTDSGVGTMIEIRGSISAQRLKIKGNKNDDTFYLYAPSFTCPVEVHGIGGSNRFFLATDRLAAPISMYGGSGSDTFNIKGRGLGSTVVLDGKGGSDTYNVDISGSDQYTIDIKDTAKDDGRDKLTINGTTSGNTFLLRRNFVSILDSSKYTERINYASNIELLEIYGGGGSNKFYLDDNSSVTRIYGGDYGNLFQIGQMYGSDNREGVSTAQTTRGYLSQGISHETFIYGGKGNDTFKVYSNKAPLWLYSQGGNNTFIIRAFALIDRSEDGKVIYNTNAPLSIEGISEDDKKIIAGTEFGRRFDKKDGISGMGLNIATTDIQDVKIVRDLSLEPGMGLYNEAVAALPKTPFMYRDIVIFMIIVIAVVLVGLILILWRRRRQRMAAEKETSVHTD